MTRLQTRRRPDRIGGLGNFGSLHRGLSSIEYFTFGFGTMIGVGWLVLMDDWLTRGGPAGGMLGFLLGGLLLFPIARTYGRLVQHIPDAGAEIAYTEGVMPPFVSFAAGWTMVLSYAIVCPWEAVATGNLLARVFPALNTREMYAIGGTPIFAPRVAVGVGLTALVAIVNYRGIKPSGIFQNVMTFGLLLTFAVFTLLGFARGSSSNLRPLFSHAGTAGAWLSIFLVLQIVPYFMTGFESVAKGSEEAHEGFDPRNFAKAIYAALVAGFLFYVIIIAVVTWVYPWQEIVSGHVRTEVAFERTFGSHAIAQLILFGAFLSLLKIFNGNFVAGTRMMYAMGKRGVVHRSLGFVHPTYGTPAVAISLLAALTMVCAMMGDAILVPITEVGSLTAGIGWLSACAALILRARPETTRADRSHPTDPAHLTHPTHLTHSTHPTHLTHPTDPTHSTHPTHLTHLTHPTHLSYPTAAAWLGAAVSLAIVLMKVIPGVPGSFTWAEWIAFAAWSGAGFVFWLLRPSPTR